MAQQFRVVVILVADIKIKRKKGTHNTLSKVISRVNGIVPIDLIGTEDPVGKLTMGIDDCFAWVKSAGSDVWSMALLSKIKGLVNIEFIEALE